VLSGIVRSGIAKLNENCLLGPDKTKNFKTVQIKSIHVSRNACDYAVAGDLACLNVKSTKANEKLVRKDIRRGMVLVGQ
jgi:GTPase